MSTPDDFRHIEVSVRGIKFKLMTYTRSLELCARMNYETENLDFIDDIKPNQVLYDLGACEGRFSIYAAMKGVKVFSFEPENRNFKVLNQNIQLNNLDNDKLMPFNIGVGANVGQGTLQIGQPWEGGHQKVVNHGDVRDDLDFKFVENQPIRITSIDSFTADGFPPPNFLKVDIDGSEMPFLDGAKTTLKSPSLRGIIFELNESDANFQRVVEILSDNGFRETKRFGIPNEPNLYNIIYTRV